MNQPVQMPPPVPVKKGKSPWMWVGIGCLGVMIVGGIATATAGYFLYSAVEEMTDDPIGMTAKLAAMGDPDIEFISADKDHGKVVLKKLSTGEEITIDYADVKDGKIEFSSGGETATIGFDPDNGEEGGLTIKSKDGTAKFGGDMEAKDVPSWVGAYPGVKLKTVMSSSARGAKTATFAFDTQDGMDDVVSFYKKKLSAAGLEVTATVTQDKHTSLMALSKDKKRNAHVMVTREDGKTTGIVNVTEKK